MSYQEHYATRVKLLKEELNDLHVQRHELIALREQWDVRISSWAHGKWEDTTDAELADLAWRIDWCEMRTRWAQANLTSLQ